MPDRHRNAIVILAKQGRATPAIQRAFLDALEKTGRVRDACSMAGIASSTAYRLRARSKRFAEAWDRARALRHEEAWETAYARAMEGWEEPVFYAGKQVGTRRRYSERLLIQLLSRTRPALERTRLRDAVKDELRGAKGDTPTPTPAELDAMRDRLHARIAELCEESARTGVAAFGGD